MKSGSFPVQTVLSKVQTPDVLNETEASDARELGATQEMEDTADSGKMRGAGTDFKDNENHAE